MEIRTTGFFAKENDEKQMNNSTKYRYINKTFLPGDKKHNNRGIVLFNDKEIII